MADMDDFDLDRSTAQAWAAFQARLSEVISMIDDSADLTIGTESESADPAPYLHFGSPSRHLIRCEAASNADLGEDFQLRPDQLAQMEALGWHPPTADGDRPSSNFWVEDTQEECDRLSQLAVAALRDVYGVQHPVFLAPDQLREVFQPDPVPIEGTVTVARAVVMATVPASQEHLDQLVEGELTAMFGHYPFRDDEGDVAIRVGSTMIFLRTSADGHEIVVFAAVVHEVDGRSRATEVLNDLNVEARWVKFQLIRDRVFVTLSIPARPFVPAHLQLAVRIMSEVADGIDDELATKLRGRTIFTDPEEPGG